LRTVSKRTWILAILVSGWAASVAEADPISQPISYGTFGSIGGVNDPSAGPITFTGAPFGSSRNFPGTFSLGQFTVPTLPTSASLTYNNTPFTINADIGAVPGGGGWPYTDVKFTGVLNGTVTGNNQSTLLASVTSISQFGPGTLPFPITAITVAPQLLTAGGASTILTAQLTDALGQVITVPEPTTLALFMVAAGGLGLRRMRRTRR
jgi:hypothetical protein